MNQSLKIFGVLRPSLLGDIIISTVFLNYLEKVFPKSYKCAYIDKKCQQILPFLINHPLIDKIQISEERDNISNNDAKFIDQFDIKYHPFIPHPYGEDFYNTRHIVCETFLMNYEIGKGYINPSEWDKLDSTEKYPKFTQWFDVERKNKTIAIWPFSGYSNKNLGVQQNLRSPSKEWWNKLIEMLPDYKIIQLGFPDSELLNHPNIIDCRDLSLFDAIKISLGCDLSITTDSGSGWLIGAYGAKQIILFTNYNPNHNDNITAYCPVNHKGNAIYIHGKNKNINNINQEVVCGVIKDFNDY